MLHHLSRIARITRLSGLLRKALGPDLINWRKAHVLASSSKRLDLCSAQFAHALHLSKGLSIKDKICLEIGSGWVLSHALVLHLLGAKQVLATDVQRIARPSSLYRALHTSRASIVRDVLSPFEEHAKIRARLESLLAIRRFSFDVLGKLGVEYLAPIDLAKRALGTKVDFVSSWSVLEHVPTDDVFQLLKNLTSDLSDGGTMIHCIHLEDHRDFERAPFDFLSESAETYTTEIQTRRGNRMRRSQWASIFSRVDGLEARFLYEWSRRDARVPDVIDPSIHYVDNDDLTISHVGILATK